MGKSKTENTKKAAGNARKQEVAARKQAESSAKAAAAEDELWAEGANNKVSKKQLEQQKKEEQRRRKAEREAEIAAEVASTKAAKPSVARKQTNKPITSSLDKALSASEGKDESEGESDGEKKKNAPKGYSARNIEDAITALQLTSGKSTDEVERHPERRFKSALRTYEEERLADLRKERPGMRLNQYKQLMYKEFQKHPDNPFNQVSVRYDATDNEVQEVLDELRQAKEERLRSDD